MIAFLKYLFTFALFVVSTTICLFFIYFTLVVHTDWQAIFHDPHDIGTTQIIAAALVAAIPLVFYILFSPIFSLEPKKSWFGKTVRFLLILAMLGFVGYQLFDARKVYEVYSVKDLTTRHPQNQSAAFLFSPILNRSSRPIPDVPYFTQTQFLATIKNNRREIEDAWQEISTYRASIDQLAELDVLPQPVRTDEEDRPDYSGLENVMRIYLAESLLLTESGDGEAGIRILGACHRVARNGLAGALYRDEKLFWAEIVARNIMAAYQIAKNPDATYEEVALLIEMFSALKLEEVSLRTVWLGEYLRAKAFLSVDAEQVARHHFGAAAKQPLLLQITPPWLFSAAYRLTCQKNRSTRILQTYWKPIIESAASRIFALGNEGISLDRYLSNPPLRNLSGWYFHRPRPYPELETEMAKLQGSSALLWAYLNDKAEFGSGLERYLSRDYYGRIVREGDTIIASGRDNRIGTDDDSVLQPLY